MATSAPPPDTPYYDTMSIDIAIQTLPAVDGRPFANVFAEHFKALTDYEAEHGPYTPKRVVEVGELAQRIGIADKTFGRERSMYVNADDAGDGPYLVISARNGGFEPSCDSDTDDPGCRCNACIQNRLVPTYPGYVHSEYNGGDAEYYFTLPGLADDEQLPDGQGTHAQLGVLADDRDRVNARTLVPWFFLPRQPERALRGTYLSAHPIHARREQTVKDIERAQQRLTRLTDAYAQAEPVSERPQPMRRRKTGVAGRPLKGTEPVPVRDFDIEYERWNNLVASRQAQTDRVRDLKRLAQVEGIAESTADWLRHEAELAERTTPQQQARDERDLAEATYRMQMAWFNAPHQMQTLREQVEAAQRRLATIDTALERSRDQDWVTYPGADYDGYVSWRAAFGYGQPR